MHRSSAVIAPGSGPDLRHATAADRKEEGVPREKAFRGKRLVVVACGIQHHFDDAFDMAVCGFEGSDVYAQPAR